MVEKNLSSGQDDGSQEVSKVGSTGAASIGSKEVCFAYVHIRDYERVVGDNPSCSDGAPVSIGWRYGSLRSIPLEEYEAAKATTRRNRKQLVLSRAERQHLLLEWGATGSEVVESIRACLKVKNQRRRTYHSLGRYDKVEATLENVSRKLKYKLLAKQSPVSVAAKQWDGGDEQGKRNYVVTYDYGREIHPPVAVVGERLYPNKTKLVVDSAQKAQFPPAGVQINQNTGPYKNRVVIHTNERTYVEATNFNSMGTNQQHNLSQRMQPQQQIHHQQSIHHDSQHPLGACGTNADTVPRNKSASKTFHKGVKKLHRPLGFIIREKNNKRCSEDSICSVTEDPSSCSLSCSERSRRFEDKGEGIIPNSPQVRLDKLLIYLGYQVQMYSTLSTGYYSTPTTMQTASYHPYIMRLAREEQHKDLLKEIMECGISPNPWNGHGESLVHMVCRTCEPETLEILLNAGASVRVSDNMGRNPLHVACGREEPCFEIIEKIAVQDLQLFYMRDSHGALPLSYVPQEQWTQWIHFLESKQDLWGQLVSQQEAAPVKLADMPPKIFPIRDPRNSLPLELVSLVVAGKMLPSEARALLMDAELSSFTEETPSVGETVSFLSSECAFTKEDFETIMASDPIGIGV